MPDEKPPARTDLDTTEAPGAAVPSLRFDVAELLNGASEIILVHNGADYRLRVTAANKLILTK